MKKMYQNIKFNTIDS